MEENKKLTEGKQENVYTITFDIVSSNKYVFIMPYEGQVSGEKFSKRFDVHPGDIISEEDFDWTKYYAIYRHDDVAVFTSKGMPVPGTFPEYTFPVVKISEKIALYAISKMPNPNGDEYVDIISNAWYVPFPIELKEMNIIVAEEHGGGAFEHRYVNP